MGIQAAASSEVVKEHLGAMGFKEVRLWPNVADVDVISAADPRESERVAGRVVFAGNLAPNKVDFKLLAGLADAGLDVRVAGPHAEGGGDDSGAFAEMQRHGVKYLGMLSLPQLADELTSATLGVIPYKLNEYTKGVSPLKTFEYLAAGLPVLSTQIPAVEPIAEHVRIVDGRCASEWVEAAVSMSRLPSQGEIEERQAIAVDHSWAGRGAVIRELVMKHVS
jgi:glycosyltransferase involved in cell wall biosynthesis